MASQIDGFLMSSRGSGGAGGKNVTMAASKKKDPIDYRRLNIGSSFLRAAFDTLNEVCSNSSAATGRELLAHNHIPVAKMILVGFVNVGKKQRLETKKNANFGLPVVNWTNILSVCFASGDLELKRLCFELCVLHASHTSAKSLVDFFVAKMSMVVDAGAGGDGDFVVRREFAFGKDGVGKLLELAGLYSGDGSADSCITVAPSKVLEILQSVVYFVYFDGSVKDMIKLSEVFDSHLNGPNKAAGLPDSLVKLKTDILNLLCEAYLSLPESPDSLHQITVIRRLVHTIFISETPQTTALLLQHILNPEAWNSKHIWALFQILEFTDTQAPWILTSHITRLFVNKDHLVVRILQFLVSQQEFQFDARPVSCVSATLTYLRYSITSKPKTDPD
ncbi:hypothetical protein BDR26DRAFT_207509 [Obelidium mucronatum]|nr:hypothetical protein BDR26DRAFT_207509 [Obelidium mucronatum]